MNFRVKLNQFFCFHSTVEIRRCHRDVCQEDHGKEAWIDIHGVYNFIRCTECYKILQALNPKYDNRIYGEPEE